jgi:hypothetical protein
MTTTQRSLFLVLAFLAGCAGAAAAPLMVQVARANPPAQRWEYDCRQANTGITDMANQLGQQGWDLTAAAGAGWGGGLLAEHNMVWCFKRPLP